MSCAVAVAVENKIILKADTRMVRYLDEDHRQYEIANDDTHKIFKINKNIAVAICGNAETCIRYRDYIQTFDHPECLKFNKVKRLLLEHIYAATSRNAHSNAVICGKDDSGKNYIYSIKFDSIDNQYKEKMDFADMPGARCFSILSSGTPQGQEVYIKFIERMQQAENIQEICDSMDSLILKISEIDLSVNNKIETIIF